MRYCDIYTTCKFNVLTELRANNLNNYNEPIILPYSGSIARDCNIMFGVVWADVREAIIL
jgi:hypothetical protein